VTPSPKWGPCLTSGYDLYRFSLPLLGISAYLILVGPGKASCFPGIWDLLVATPSSPSPNATHLCSISWFDIPLYSIPVSSHTWIYTFPPPLFCLSPPTLYLPCVFYSMCLLANHLSVGIHPHPPNWASSHRFCCILSHWSKHMKHRDTWSTINEHPLSFCWLILLLEVCSVLSVYALNFRLKQPIEDISRDHAVRTDNNGRWSSV